jgi:hypothetical protein
METMIGAVSPRTGEGLVPRQQIYGFSFKKNVPSAWPLAPHDGGSVLSSLPAPLCSTTSASPLRRKVKTKPVGLSLSSVSTSRRVLRFSTVPPMSHAPLPETGLVTISAEISSLPEPAA